jgi:hypothetical protein
MTLVVGGGGAEALVPDSCTETQAVNASAMNAIKPKATNRPCDPDRLIDMKTSNCVYDPKQESV